MNGKIEFGIDYLTIMRNLQFLGHPNKGGFDVVDDAAALVFLLQWGFTPDEIDDASNQWIKRATKGALPTDLYSVAKKIADYIKDDTRAQHRFVIQLAAVGLMDGNITPEEDNFVVSFRDLFDMRLSEFETLLKQGDDWARGLNYFGMTFAKDRGTSSPFHQSS